MGPVLEELAILPEQTIELRWIVRAQPAPEDEPMAGGHGADGIELEAAELPNYIQHRRSAG
ncbi:MAG: hypothetical protein PVSMB9_01740 [Candidatus Dormibacteria bacterium]